MKLLVIGHSYALAFAQSKYVAMKRLDPSLRVRIVAPPEFGHVFMRYHHSRHPDLGADEALAIPTILGRTHMTYALHPWRLWKLLREFAPDHVHIEEDPHSLVGTEAVTLTRMACPRATLSFFIWDNLARTLRFPLNSVKKGVTWYSLARAVLVVCGNSEAEHLLRTVKGYRGRTAVLPQVGLDPDDYVGSPPAAVRAQLPAIPGEPLIGFIGRWVPEKGLIVLLEALSRLQHLKWRLLVVGNGPLKDDVQRRWRPLFGERLLSLEAVPHGDLPGYFKCLDIFVLPSYRAHSWKEQFGLTLAQAMMAGVACVGSSSGAIPEVLGGAGMIVPERDVAGLARALEVVIRSESVRQSLGEKAKVLALKRYTNEVVAGGYLSAFRATARGQSSVGIRPRAANKPKVGIILPVRNNARFIRQALESALNQSYSNIEILVVDGASTDGTQDVVRSFSSVRLVSEPDRGQAEATNKGIDRTDSDILVVLCGDDVLHPDGVKVAMETFAAHPDADIVFGQVGKIDQFGNWISPGDRFGDFDVKKVLLHNARFPYISYPSTTAFIRRSLLTRTGFRFDETIRTCPDFDMWLQLGSRGKVVYVPEVLACWREHPESTTVSFGLREVVVESKRRALDKFFGDQSIAAAVDLRKLEPAAYAMLEIADSACYLIRHGSAIKGFAEALTAVKNAPRLLAYPYVYGLLSRALVIRVLKAAKLYNFARTTRMRLARFRGVREPRDPAGA